jgi:hypothetical protein
MGLSHIKNDLVENLLIEKGKTPEKHVVEADKTFTNPLLSKKVSYKDKDGNPKDGIVGNLLRLPKDSPGRVAAEKLLPPEGSPERDAMNKDLGGEGQPKKPEDGKGKEGGEEAPKEDPAKAAAVMFDPKSDPAMGARMDKEKDANAQLAKDAEADKEVEKEQEPKKEDEFAPIDSKDVAKEMPQADPETFAGGSDIPDGVEPEQLQKFNTDIQKVAQQVADAKAKGEPAPNINLCDVTVPGTNLYCDDNLGIPRDEMPQFKGTAQPGSRAAEMDADASGEVDTEPVFKEMLKEKGIKTLQTEIPADKLKATQKDLVGAKVVGMMGTLEKDPTHPKITAPIYVSRDGHVIDGHHRWAAIVAHNAANPDKQIPMKTTVLDMDIKDAIPMANKFAEDMGIAAKKADANKETPSEPQKVTSAPKITEKIKKKIENWTEKEKAFFDRNEGAPGSELRRSLGQTLKDKAKGALKAIKKGFKHEVEEFKEAGKGVQNFFSGKPLSKHEQKALKAVAFKVVTTALFGAALGGTAHGAAYFAKHVAMEFIPHIVGETLLKGVAKAAVFADADGEAETDANILKFTEMIAKGLEEMEITPEMMEQMVDSYNEKKENGEVDSDTTTTGVKAEHLHLVDELMLEMIYGFIEEATATTKDWKLAARIGGPDGKIVYFGSKERKDKALNAGTHFDVDKKLNAKAEQPKNKPVAGADLFDKGYKDARGGQTDKKSTAPSGKLPKKMEEDDIFFSKDAVERKATEADTKVDSLPIGAKEKAIIKGVIRKVLKGQDLTANEIKVASDWITFPATSDAKIYFASEAGNFKDHDKFTISSSMSEEAREQFNEFLENNEVFDAGHPVKKKSMVASKLTPKRTFTKVENVKKDKEGNVTSVTVGNTTLERISLPTEKELVKEFKKQGIQNPEQEAKDTIVAIERHNANVTFLASQKDIETIDFGHDTNSSEGRRDTIESIKKLMAKKLMDDFTKYYKGKANIPKEARNILNLINNLSNPYINPSGNAAEKLQQEIDAIAILMNNNPDFRAGVPDMQEIFDFVVKLGQGYAGFMPSASNWKVTDIVTYKPTQSFKFKKGESPAEAIAKNLQTFKSTVLIEGGSSVKYEKGGASAGLDKILMTVYNKHKGFDTQKELVKLFDIYKWSFTPGEESRVKSQKEIQAKEAELNDTLNRAVTAGIISPEEKKEILAEGEKQAAAMAAKVEKKVPFEKYKQCFGKTPEEQKKNYDNYKKQLGLWCKMGAMAEVINNNDARYQLFGNLRTKYPKKGPPKHEVIDGVNVLSGMGWSYDPGISATGKDCKYISMNNANSSHIEPIKRKG